MALGIHFLEQTRRRQRKNRLIREIIRISMEDSKQKKSTTNTMLAIKLSNRKKRKKVHTGGSGKDSRVQKVVETFIKRNRQELNNRINTPKVPKKNTKTTQEILIRVLIAQMILSIQGLSMIKKKKNKKRIRDNNLIKRNTTESTTKNIKKVWVVKSSNRLDNKSQRNI